LLQKTGDIMKTINNQKLETLYQYFEKNGFDKTIDEISKGINVTKKTIFNRYENRENMESILQSYWRQRFRKNFLEKCQYCNNMVEVLIFMIYELKRSFEVEKYFFEREMDLDGFFLSDDENSIVSVTKRIINKGIELALFTPDIDIYQYSRFFIHNIVYFFIKDQCREDIVQYVLPPLLTESGLIIMQDINLSSFFEISNTKQIANPKRFLIDTQIHENNIPK
jgi:hypothetical protein